MDWRNIEKVNKYNKLNSKLNRLVNKMIWAETLEEEERYKKESLQALEELEHFKRINNIKGDNE